MSYLEKSQLIIERLPENISLVNQLEAEGIKDKRTLRAILRTPRHLFIPPDYPDFLAYKNQVIPLIENRSSISQPYIVALMTELLNPQKKDQVLEIGTASGWQTAILSRLAHTVVSVEYLPELIFSAKQAIDDLGIKNVEILIADGSIRFTPRETFDKIIVSSSVPPYSCSQILSLLKENGRCVIPLGGKENSWLFSSLISIQRKMGEFVLEKETGTVIFVPLMGRRGWEAFSQILEANNLTAHQAYSDFIQDLSQRAV